MSVDSIFSADCYCHKNNVNVWKWIVKKTYVKCNLISFAYPNCIASCEYCSRLATKPQWLVYRVVDWLDVRTLDERMRGFQTRWLTCRRVHRFSKTAQNPDRIAVVIYCCTQPFKVHILFPSVNISIAIQKQTGLWLHLFQAMTTIFYFPYLSSFLKLYGNRTYFYLLTLKVWFSTSEIPHLEDLEQQEVQGHKITRTWIVCLFLIIIVFWQQFCPEAHLFGSNWSFLPQGWPTEVNFSQRQLRRQWKASRNTWQSWTMPCWPELSLLASVWPWQTSLLLATCWWCTNRHVILFTSLFFILTLSLLSLKSTFSQHFEETMYKWGSENLSYNASMWEAGTGHDLA